MPRVDLAGVGVWSESFSDWEQFKAVAGGAAVDAGSKLQPELISPRERRRAPQFVKMAVEVMDQACRMAGVDRSAAATVFASGMGDMQITDYMCRTLATMPRTISPTRFHNSVHNAATGYWSIATASHAPANAVSGYDHSGAIALLEAAIQVVEEDVPVLLAVQEASAPQPFKSVYDSEQPFAVAFLLAPKGRTSSPLAELVVELSRGEAPKEEPQPLPGLALQSNYAASLLGLLVTFADGAESRLTLPLSDSAALSVDVIPAGTRERVAG